MSNDMKDLLSRWERDKQERAKKNRQFVEDNVTRLQTALLALGIKTVTAEYNGSGDDGSMDDVVFDKDISHLDEHNYFQNQVKELLYNLLDSRDVGDWVNNEGGFGSFVWDVETNNLKHEHHQRVMSTEDSEFDGWETWS